MQTLAGEVLSVGVTGELDGEIRITLLWSSPEEVDLRADGAAELYTESVISWSMELYHPPSEDLLNELFSDAPAAIGFPVLYVDADGSGEWNEENIIGGSPATFVMYFFDESPPPPDGGEGPLAEGYNVVQSPSCEVEGPLRPVPTDPTQVNLMLGELFFTGLPDIDCDGDIDEWDLLCEYGCEY